MTLYCLLLIDATRSALTSKCLRDILKTGLHALIMLHITGKAQLNIVSYDSKFEKTVLISVIRTDKTY